MDHETDYSGFGESTVEPADVYQPPDVTYLGTVAELTQGKDDGRSDGAGFFLDISVG